MKTKILIPNVQRYTLTYKNQRGEVKTYEVSPPIEKSDDSMTVYAFGKGIRTFKIARITDIQ